jgi:dCMP deaminase
MCICNFDTYTMVSFKATQFMELARTQARLFSKDPHKKVGAIFVDPESMAILSTGYNGFCRGIHESDFRWERKNKSKYVIHAEVNGIYNACRRGISLNNSVAVVTMFPCLECAKSLIQCGVTSVVTVKPDYNDERWGGQFRMSMDMFEEVGMKMNFVDSWSEFTNENENEHDHEHSKVR